MKYIEQVLELRLNDEQEIDYPDFSGMWVRIEEAGNISGLNAKTGQNNPSQRRGRNWRKTVTAASLAALLAAAPVYAAVQYDWSGLLHSKSGIQAALTEHLGQKLDQSVTHEGITLTLHTAVVDENRTFILYSLDPGEQDRGEMWKFKGISLKDEQGRVVDGWLSDLTWDEASQTYQGYFESNWTPEAESAKVELIARDLQSLSRQEQPLVVDAASRESQHFSIAQDGLRGVDVQLFSRDDNKLLIYSEVAFEQKEAAAWSNPQILAYRNGAIVNELPDSRRTRPGDNGEYISQQSYSHSDVANADTSYRLQYMKEEERLNEDFTFDLELSKKQMLSGTAKYALNKPLEEGSSDTILEQMVVTPTQIRVSFRTQSSYVQLPYEKITLEVNGMSLQGERRPTAERDPNQGTICFERPWGLEINGVTPVTLTGKSKITSYKGDRAPVRLTGISGNRQSVTSQVGGHPVEWIYYTLDGDLYVETGSNIPGFDGIFSFETTRNKSYFAGKTFIVNYPGDDDSTVIDRYEGYKQTEASMFVSSYITVEPEKETQIRLLP